MTVALKKRLVAGCVNRYEAGDGWANIHLDASKRNIVDEETQAMAVPDICGRIEDLPLENESFDEIRCWQTLEHVKRYDAEKALNEFHRVLRSGGVLDVEVPDLSLVIHGYCDGKFSWDDLLLFTYGEQFEAQPDDDLMTHRWGWNESSLAEALSAAGFDPGKPLSPEGPVRYRALKEER